MEFPSPLSIASGVASILLACLLITWGINASDSDSGRCGDGTTRIGYHKGKTTVYVCERTPQ